MPDSPGKPEARARRQIDAALIAAGWAVQDKDAVDLYAAVGVAVRELPLKAGHGRADYVLFVNHQPVGVFEAKPAGHTLSGVEPQARLYATGLPGHFTPSVDPLPFMYVGTGVATYFANLLDPKPRSRETFAVHRPETLAAWLKAETLDTWVRDLAATQPAPLATTAADDSRPSSFRARLQVLPELVDPRLFPNQTRAIVGLEKSLRQNKPRALIKMATGSGKTRTAITALYRLFRYGGAGRVLFLVDRTNLGEQAEDAFKDWTTHDTGRPFTELYPVQRLTSNRIGDASMVLITTVQRLYAMLRGEPDFDPDAEEASQFDDHPEAGREPLPVVYDAAIPPEMFDVVVIDECHRSIYSVWRQVLEYFDAFMVGLSATPDVRARAFFKQNLVIDYDHAEAVVDGVNVPFEIYEIRTRITRGGSKVMAAEGHLVGYRTRKHRKIQYRALEEDLVYAGKDLDRSVVAPDQIRTVVKAFRDQLLPSQFAGRSLVPKTIVFAKDDNHAEDLARIIREEFGEGDDFCRKITYRSTGKKPKDLIAEFRTSVHFRVAVTVDMIAVGTDIKPVEIVWFMRAVKSRTLHDQMRGRGVRVIDPKELTRVTPDAPAEGKERFIVVDCVGQARTKLADAKPLERRPHVPLSTLLDAVGLGSLDPDYLATLAGRLVRLENRLPAAERAVAVELSGGPTLREIARGLVMAVDPQSAMERARGTHGLGPDAEPSNAQIEAASVELRRAAAKPLASKPKLRKYLADAHDRVEQLIDETSADRLEYAGPSETAREEAEALVQSFETYLEDHREELDALQFFYGVPARRQLKYRDIKALAEAIRMPPRAWTPRALWRAYEVLEGDRVRGASGQRLLVDLVSLVRFALEDEGELVPFAERVDARFTLWLAQQETAGQVFDDEQRRWLEMMRQHIAGSVELGVEDFGYAPFAEAGGLGRARQVFGGALGEVMQALNEVLAA